MGQVRRVGHGRLKMWINKHPEDYFEQGVACWYHPNGGSPGQLSGLKIFRSRRERDYSYRNQKRVAARKLAPRVGGRFKILIHWRGTRKTWRRWGYYTEIADTTTEVSWAEGGDIGGKLCDLFPSKDFSDDHPDNLGYVKGRLVWLDFGEESIKKWRN